MTKTADQDFSRQWFGPYNREKPNRTLKILARRRLNRIHFSIRERRPLMPSITDSGGPHDQKTSPVTARCAASH